jgi:hypothetical protein
MENFFQKLLLSKKQHSQLKDNHDHLLDEIERYNNQLKQEQQRVVSLKTELKNTNQFAREIIEVSFSL